MIEDDYIRAFIKYAIHFIIVLLIGVSIVATLTPFKVIVIIANLIYFGFLARKIWVWEKQNRSL